MLWTKILDLRGD